MKANLPNKPQQSKPKQGMPMNPAANSVSNPNLLKAIDAMKAENTPKTQNDMINELVRGTYLMQAVVDLNGQQPEKDANGRPKLPPNAKITFPMLGTKDGKQYFAAYTDVQELSKAKSSTQLAVLVFRFDDFARMLEQNAAVQGKADGVILNPFGANLRFPAEMILSIKKQKDEFAKKPPQQVHRIQPGDNVVMMEPSVMPDALLDPLCEVLKQDGTVNAAYLQIMVVNETHKSYLLVLDGTQNPAIFPQLGAAAKPYISAMKSMNLDITLASSPIGQQAVQGSDPFYTKEQGRIYDEDDEEE